ncbi:hypothetical protein [Kitasatospora sp. NPDC093679]|uniref:hypothetical protein n=1 Tax=Kitasatospora sp. NPDC093679 TaxID=3154983 RepID=UPI00343E9C4E
MVRRTPREKKRLSYLKDCRNAYGENDKGSRPSVRRRKRAVNSVNRRLHRTVLATLSGRQVGDRAAEVAERADGRRRKRWRKVPDAPLGELLARRAAAADDDRG